jgi:hypothetical protein
MSTRTRTPESRSSEARKLKERFRRNKPDTANPKRREAPKVLTPQERMAASEPAKQEAAE